MAILQTVSNQELLFEDMKAQGYTGAMLSSRDALAWLVNNNQALAPGSSASQQVEVNRQDINSLKNKGGFKGHHAILPTVVTGYVDGDTILVGREAAMVSYTFLNGKFEKDSFSTIRIGTAQTLPIGLAPSAAGYTVYDQVLFIMYIWNGYTWSVVGSSPIVSGYRMSIVS